MGISVTITTPIPTDDELAKELGISAKRQRDIARIVEEAAQSLKSKSSRRTVSSRDSSPRSKAA